MKSSPTGRVALLLFGSGLCALIYQIAWLRELRLVFGASTAASAAVLGIFMGGLGAGGLVFGKRAAAAPRPLALYARLEAAIAVASALTPLFVVLARRLYAAVGGTPALGLGGGTVARLVLAAVVLGVPTLLMGGTLPAAAQAVTRRSDVGRRDLAILYGANTLGAVAGAALSTFVLLEALGTRRMLLSACALNLVVAALALLLATRLTDRSVSEADHAEEGAPSADGEPLSPRFVLAAAAIVGFVFLLMELVWYRMLAPLLGGSSYTFGLILAVALFGIGAGGVAYALSSGRRAATLTGFALTCALEAVALAVPFALGDRLAVWAATLRPLGAHGFHGFVAGWTLLTSVVVLPTALLSGVQFPLLIALYGGGRRDVGRQVGNAYAWNTAGAIAGSLAGGFGLMPLISAPGCWRLAAALLAALGLAAVALAKKPRVATLAAPILAAGIAFGLLVRTGPTAAWRHGSVGVGRAPATGTQSTFENWARDLRRNTRWQREGVESSVAINDKSGFAFVVNGKVDGNARSDASTQVMAGLMGALVHPAVHRSLVVGLGTGSTAGWLAQVPTMERVDVVELEPAILEVARFCAPVNRGVLDNPRVHVTIGDAREVVGTTRARYDLIFSEPSNPYRAGIASLFTSEFYRAASAKLVDDGLFVQWLQAYNVDAQTIREIYATLSSVFPDVESWVTEESDLLLIAGKRPLTYDVARLRARIAEEPWKTALARVWRADDLEAVFARYVANADFARSIAAQQGDQLNTDDRTRVEFGFARGLGLKRTELEVTELRNAAVEHGDATPRLVDGTLNRLLVEERALSMAGADFRSTPTPRPRAAPVFRFRSGAVQHWIDGEYAAAVSAWRMQHREPDDSIERATLAESLADAGSSDAEPYIAALRPTHDVEADLYQARLQYRQQHTAEAAATLERGFAGAERDPWILPVVLQRAIDLAVEIGESDRDAAERFWRVLATPFVVHLQNDHRLRARAQLAWAIDWPRLCTEALAPMEPDVAIDRELLERRVRCYEATGDARLARARADLARYSR